ncbi:MAG: CopG family transcriptional regulator [Eubacterium sp.]|nr:CopG family transcriptional regulator [Eubacterium sp.]MCM1213162.1 CopG family transcriptional regulator [Lachnospiraceae bacterium]MCM1239466.1 CopG family transcriptional regulator [Lachnospiraceae bacterium]
MEKFVVVPKEDKAVTMTIRIDRVLQEQYNELAAKTNRSRNELIGMALQYALDNMVIQDLKIVPVAIFENSEVGDVDSQEYE